MLRTLFHQTVCKLKAFTFIRSNTHIPRHNHTHSAQIIQQTLSQNKYFVYADAQLSFGLQSYASAFSSLRLVWRQCTKRANPILSQPFLSIRMLPINSEPGGKEETWPIKTLMAFPNSRSGLQWCFYDVIAEHTCAPSPTRHTTKETDKVLMFNGGKKNSHLQQLPSCKINKQLERRATITLLIKPNWKCALHFLPAVSLCSPVRRILLCSITVQEMVGGNGWS